MPLTMLGKEYSAVFTAPQVLAQRKSSVYDLTLPMLPGLDHSTLRFCQSIILELSSRPVSARRLTTEPQNCCACGCGGSVRTRYSLRSPTSGARFRVCRVARGPSGAQDEVAEERRHPP